jgi:thymidylate synthase (FAD)
MNNTVELLGFYGSDEVIACSAWTSTSRELSEDKVKRIPALIDMLWSNGHETPFEKATVHFLVNCDIASHIHLLKHRMASINAESARYKELKEDKFYLPKDWNGNNVDFTNFNSYDDLTFKGIETWKQLLESYTEMGNRMYHECLTQLTPVLGRKRAKESARFFKTYNSQIQADVMFNMRSFANFLKLRNSEHAQVEIREIAQEMLSLVQNIEGNPFEQTIKSIIKNGKSN